ncbi:MFS transporter [Nocardia mexicana]|uniref:Putative MFS family arabinose efflux permease n=1 Tax=Nocardia mexicana TaxID=279262 RepID=A0A370HBL2_9NOCA|nr:MFS transporter [Nocardia mexicana]RDI54319.1 putative MFS family arabinose efflux permease [Nocardia mexicana]
MSVTIESSRHQRLSPPRWAGVWCLSFGIFVIVTSEILPVGLLNPIVADYAVSSGVGGLLLTLPGLTALVSAPLATVATRRLDRRRMLVVFLLILALANLLCLAAPAFWLVLVGRALVGLVIGGYWSIGAGLSPRLVPPGAVTAATAIFFAAVPVGSVLGVPLGTQLGQAFGWRLPFAVLCGLSVAGAIALRCTLPRLPALQVTSAAVLLGLLRKPGTGVRTGLVVTALVVVAHFAAYTYLAPFLRDTTGVDDGTVGGFLLVYGVAGVAGTLATSRTLARSLRGTLAASAGLIAVGTVLLPVLGRWPAGALVLLIVWGLAYGTVPACSQTWFARSAPHAPEAASVLFTASFQATLAMGALVGGRVVDASSTATVMVCAGLLAMVTVLVVGAIRSPGSTATSVLDDDRPAGSLRT